MYKSDRLRGVMLTLYRAIMDYQYKSINRGENSIYGQIEKEGVDPTKHIFVFNLRSYDRLNKTPAMQKQEEKSGVSYQEVQRAQAEEVMSSGVHGVKDDSGSSSEGETDDSGDEQRERAVDKKRKFEAKRHEAGIGGEGGEREKKVPSVDSIAKDAMLGEKKVSEEKWDDGDMEQEKGNFVQEELYIHGKVSNMPFFLENHADNYQVCIVDDRIVLCGSSNINDRVRSHHKHKICAQTNLFTVPTRLP